MQYDFNLPPGGGMQIEVKGRFFKYLSGTGPIRVRASNGGYVDLLPGQGVWSLDYSSLTVQDRSNAQNAGVLIAGDFDFRDDRIAGTVDVVDGGKSRTAAGISFVGAANGEAKENLYCVSQIWNPAGSGKNAIIESIVIGTSEPMEVALAINENPMTKSIYRASNKKAGSQLSVCEMRVDNISGVPSGVVTPFMVLFMGRESLVIKLSEPSILRPGSGVYSQGLIVGARCNAAFEFYEDTI